MALAVGDTVFQNVGTGLLADAPLLGTINFLLGAAPNETGVNWENGHSSAFSIAAAAAALVEAAPDPDERDILGLNAQIRQTPRLAGLIVRSYIADPDGAAVRTVIFQTCGGKYVVEAFANLTVRKAAFFSPPC